MSVTTDKTSDKQFSKHTAEFREKTSELGQDFQELGRITNHLYNDAAHMAQNNVVDLYKQGKAQASKLSDKIEKQIGRNPVQALLIATGVGLVLGTIWNQRRKRLP